MRYGLEGVEDRSWIEQVDLKSGVETTESESLSEAERLLLVDVAKFNVWRMERSASVLDLRDVDLSNQDLRGAMLFKIRFDRGKFENVNLEGANVMGSSFVLADLAGANLLRAHAELADFTGSNLTGASFQETYLTLSNLSGANVQGVRWDGSDMTLAIGADSIRGLS